MPSRRGWGGRSDHSCRCPRRRPRGGGTLRKSKSSAAAAPAVTSTSTGPHVMGRLTCEDDVEAGVSSTTTMMTTVATRTTPTGGAAEFPDGVGDKFETPLVRDEMEFGPSGVAASPPSGPGLPGGGGSRNADDGSGKSSQFRRGKNRRGNRRRGGRTYARTRLRAGVVCGANRAAYVAEGPTEGGGGSTRIFYDARPTTMTACARGSTPGRGHCRMFPSLDESYDPGSAFFRAGGGGQGR